MGKGLVSHDGQSLSQLLHILQDTPVVAPEYILLWHYGEELLRVILEFCLLFLLSCHFVTSSVSMLDNSFTKDTPERHMLLLRVETVVAESPNIDQSLLPPCTICLMGISSHYQLVRMWV